jgi:hypothetical protein
LTWRLVQIGIIGREREGSVVLKVASGVFGKKRVSSGIEGRLHVDKLVAGDSGDKNH